MEKNSEWTFTDAAFADTKGSYDFWKNNDFRFKARLNNPEWLCDSMNELQSLRDQLASERNKNEDLEKHIERIVFEFCEYSGIGKISGYYHKPFSSPPALTDRWKDFKIDKAKNLLNEI
jgi:hypothetical protein